MTSIKHRPFQRIPAWRSLSDAFCRPLPSQTRRKGWGLACGRPTDSSGEDVPRMGVDGARAPCFSPSDRVRVRGRGGNGAAACSTNYSASASSRRADQPQCQADADRRDRRWQRLRRRTDVAQQNRRVASVSGSESHTATARSGSLTLLRSVSSACASRRDTCICEQPISCAICVWVMFSKNRSTSTHRRRPGRAAIRGRTDSASTTFASTTLP